MQPKIAIIDFETKFGYSIRHCLEKGDFRCDLYTDVCRHQPEGGLVKFCSVYGGVAEVPLADYAVAFIGSLREGTSSAEEIISTWKKLGICCIGSSLIQVQTLLMAGAEFLVDPQHCERFVGLWFPGIYQKACDERKVHYSN